MFYYIYRITNKVNGKIYVGVHKTNNLEDGYMGSGKVIRRAIKKHGIENFTKDILEFFENAELMYAREKEIVTDDFLLREDTYNIRRGGTGGFDYINKSPALLSRRNKKIAKVRDHTNQDRARAKIVNTDEYRALHKERMWRYFDKSGRRGFFAGQTHTAATKQAIGRANSRHMQGKGNHQYGTHWITNGLVNAKIVDGNTVPTGWYRGRVMNVTEDKFAKAKAAIEGFDSRLIIEDRGAHPLVPSNAETTYHHHYRVKYPLSDWNAERIQSFNQLMRYYGSKGAWASGTFQEKGYWYFMV